MNMFETQGHTGFHVTPDIPGVGGIIKQRPEDFLVDEIPAYEPCGEGEHIYLLIQKRELTTLQVTELLANHFGVPRRAIGYAGRKDKHAITRQVFSIHAPGRKIEDFGLLSNDRLAVLWADRHTNKLRLGHLRGNRFSIRIRNVEFSGVLHARKALDVLERSGVPNRFGVQRFGLLGNNHRIGRAMITREFQTAMNELLGPRAEIPAINSKARSLYASGEYSDAINHYPASARTEREALRALARTGDAAKAAHAMHRSMLRFYIAAFQSAVFNDILDRRINDNTWASLLHGDIAFKHDSGAVFPVASAVDSSLAQRLRTIEISPSAPMWSGKVMQASGKPGEVETDCLTSSGVSLEQLEAFTERAPQLIQGSRRPLRVPLGAPEVEGGVDEHGSYIRCAFDLPRGSFATSVLAEVMKGGNIIQPAVQGVDASIFDDEVNDE